MGKARVTPPLAHQGALRWHVVVGHMGATDQNGNVLFQFRGACGQELHGEPRPARKVPAADRCQAPGCRALWPPLLRSVG